MEPVIEHPDQAQEAARKLAELAGRTGKKPNIWFSCWMTWAGWMSASMAEELP
ncbi:MAG TPA: hypothetical protein VNZ94_04110 [Xanthobacteraceae bacterium]|nr:hypothetical protein [Xanthobacteraceae bacterium]